MFENLKIGTLNTNYLRQFFIQDDFTYISAAVAMINGEHLAHDH